MNRRVEYTWAAPALRTVLVVLAALPWIDPFAGGPSPSVQPWLLSLAFGSLLWLFRVHLTPELVLRGWLLAAALSALAGLLQYLGWSAGLAPWVVPTGAGEAFGNLRQRNQFATLTNMGLTALLWLVAMQRETRFQPQLISQLAAMLLAAANAAASSRTGVMQLVMLLALAWLWRLWKKAEVRRLLLTALISYGAATLILPALIGMDASEHGLLWRLRQGDSVCDNRITLWANVLQLIIERPWTGWGWGELEYAHFMTLYPGTRFCAIMGNAHNLPLHLAAELGIPTAILSCSLALGLIWHARPWSETDPARQAAWAVLAVILLHSMLEYPLWYGPFLMALLLCLWLLRDASQAAPPRPGELTLAAGLLGLIAYAAWDYHRISQIYLPPEQRLAMYRDDPMEHARASWLFRQQVRFAEYTLTPLTRENAAQLHDMGLTLLHFSPEARVVEKLIESALLLGRDEEARFYLARYRIASPRESARWLASQTTPPSLGR